MKRPTMSQALDEAQERIHKLELERDALMADVHDLQAAADDLMAERDSDRAYAWRLHTFIFAHIDLSYSAAECGQVLELRPLTPVEQAISRAVAPDELWDRLYTGWVD